MHGTPSPPAGRSNHPRRVRLSDGKIEKNAQTKQTKKTHDLDCTYDVQSVYEYNGQEKPQKNQQDERTDRPSRHALLPQKAYHSAEQAPIMAKGKSQRAKGKKKRWRATRSHKPASHQTQRSARQLGRTVATDRLMESSPPPPENQTRPPKRNNQNKGEGRRDWAVNTTGPTPGWVHTPHNERLAPCVFSLACRRGKAKPPGGKYREARDTRHETKERRYFLFGRTYDTYHTRGRRWAHGRNNR